MKIDGEWDSVLMAKDQSGVSGFMGYPAEYCALCQVSILSLQAQQVFVDANSPIIKKEDQEAFKARAV